jgi:hypothetical protein
VRNDLIILGGRDVNVFSAAVPKRHAPRDNIARDL